MIKHDNAEDREMFNIENSILRLDKMIQSKHNFPQEKLELFKFLLEQVLENIKQIQQPLPDVCTHAERKNSITLTIRKDVRNEIKNELKTKSSLNLCIEDDFVEFMKKFCDISSSKSIQASRLVRIYNNITGSDLTVRRMGIIMKSIFENYPIAKCHRNDGTWYTGLDVKKEYLNENDDVII